MSIFSHVVCIQEYFIVTFFASFTFIQDFFFSSPPSYDYDDVLQGAFMRTKKGSVELREMVEWAIIVIIVILEREKRRISEQKVNGKEERNKKGMNEWEP